MSRTTTNPLRNEKAPNFIRDIVLLVVTHLPEMTSEYHKERFEIVKACLNSMRSRAKRTHTFYVFDNGSCEEFRDWLYNGFNPTMVTFSPNIGKAAARTTAIQSLPFETLVAYSDDDILYYDDWLNPQIKLLNSFPNVSAVCGTPIRTMQRWGNKNTLTWARKNATVTEGRFILEDWEKDYADGIGRTWERHLELTEKDVDYLIEFDGMKAYAHAHHCQFVSYVAKVFRALSYDGMAAGPEKSFDETLDKFGLRLCTTERYCRHMGNVIDEKLRIEIDELYGVKDANQEK